jgi:tRNA(Ile)-lysidine synthase TilS/MesJ
MLGHHMDDVVVTTFMNMTQGRKFQVMAPKNKLTS